MNNSILLSDFYEFTMTQANHKNGKNNEITTFDLFFRKIPDGGGYVIANGLSEVIEYIKNLKVTDEEIEFMRSLNTFEESYLEELRNFKFNGDIYAVPDGTVVFPNEPLITVKARALEAQIIETRLLQIMNYGSLITTKANRISRAADGRGVMEFGARRAHGDSTSVRGAKYAYTGGCVATSNTLTGKEFGVPLSGTVAHSYIQMFDSEYDAFLSYAKAFPNNTTLLIDTYDTLNSGLINAIRVAKEYLIPNGYRLKGVRLDSGDLAYLSKKVREKLDEEGLTDTKIVASNSLNEYLIEDLIHQGAPIDLFGVGENLITAASEPVFGGVYKLVEIEGKPKIKVSENIIKITNPGHKKTVRFYDQETGMALGDVLFLKDTVVPKDEYTMFDEVSPWKKQTITNYRTRELQVPIFIGGELVYEVPTIEETRQYTHREVESLYEEIKRLKNPHKYIVDLDYELYNLKQSELKKHKDETLRLELKL